LWWQSNCGHKPTFFLAGQNIGFVASSTAATRRNCGASADPLSHAPLRERQRLRVKVAARRLGGHWLIFAEASVRGQRQIRRLFVGPRSTVCEAFAEPILDE